MCKTPLAHYILAGASIQVRAKRAVGTTGAVSEANVSRATGGMCWRRRIPSKPGTVSRRKKKRVGE